MSGFAPIPPPSRSQRDAEADDTRARELAGEFGRLLEGRRESLARTASARAEAGMSGGGERGGSSLFGELVGSAFGRGAFGDASSGRGSGQAPERPTARASERSAGEGEPAEGVSERADGGTRRSNADASRTRSKGRAPDDARRQETSGGEPHDATSAHAERSTGTAPVESGTDGTATRARDDAGDAATSRESLERDRHAGEALAEAGAARVRERVPDAERDAGEERSSSPTDPTAAGAPPDRSPPTAAEKGRAEPVEAHARPRLPHAAVAEIARLLAERVAADERSADASDPGAWRFSLVDADDDAALAFVVTRHASGQLSVALDEGDEAGDAALLEELAARLAELDERVVLEEPARG